MIAHDLCPFNFFGGWLFGSGNYYGGLVVYQVIGSCYHVFVGA